MRETPISSGNVLGAFPEGSPGGAGRGEPLVRAWHTCTWSAGLCVGSTFSSAETSAAGKTRCVLPVGLTSAIRNTKASGWRRTTPHLSGGSTHRTRNTCPLVHVSLWYDRSHVRLCVLGGSAPERRVRPGGVLRATGEAM